MKTLFLLALCLFSAMRAAASGDSLATTYLRLSEHYAYRDADSARHYCRLGLEHADPSCPEPYLLLLNNLADACINLGDTREGLRLLQKTENEARRLQYLPTFRATVWTSMGVAYRLQEQPDSALVCYRQALELLQGEEARAEEAHLLSSIAVLYANTSRLDEALDYAGRAIRSADLCDDIDMKFYAHTTAGSIQVLRGENVEAVRLIRPVLSESVRQQKPAMELKCITFLLGMFQRMGQRDSIDRYVQRAETVLPRLPEASTEAQGYRETLYMILSDLGRYRESLRIQHLLAAQPQGNLLGPPDKLYLYMARNYHALHEADAAATWYERAYATADSLHAARIEAQLSELTVKYQTQEKELQIARLSEQRQKERAQSLQWLVAAVVLLFLLVALAGWTVMRRRRARRDEELKMARSYIEGLEGERARLAKDLHDGVCNDLLGIGMQIQALPAGGDLPGRIVPLIEQVRQEVRSISHELMPPRFQHVTLDEMLRDYVSRIAPAGGQPVVDFRSEARGLPWAAVPGQVSYEVYRVVQELLSNLLRHGRATHVDIRLSLESALLTLYIRHDGSPASPATTSRSGGIGLETIRERATALGGTLSQENGADGSPQFYLRVPLSARKA